MDDVRGLMLRSVHTRCVSNIVIVRLSSSSSSSSLQSLTPLYRLFSDLDRLYFDFLFDFWFFFFFSPTLDKPLYIFLF